MYNYCFNFHRCVNGLSGRNIYIVYKGNCRMQPKKTEFFPNICLCRVFLCILEYCIISLATCSWYQSSRVHFTWGAQLAWRCCRDQISCISDAWVCSSVLVGNTSPKTPSESAFYQPVSGQIDGNCSLSSSSVAIGCYTSRHSCLPPTRYQLLTYNRFLINMWNLSLHVLEWSLQVY